jgi:nucleotide-binding universal stress UspA family protein
MSDYARILVTTDLSPEALPGVVEAGKLARRLGSRVTLLYVVQDRLPPLVLASSGSYRDKVLEEHRRAAEDRLADYGRENLPGCQVEALVRVGVPFEIILETAAEQRVDLIVMASHGYGVTGQVLFGSTTQRVLHHAELPVMVVRSR